MRPQASFLSPGKFQGHCKMFLKVLRCVLPYVKGKGPTLCLHEHHISGFLSDESNETLQRCKSSIKNY